ncbi:MAG: hypothetical protein EA379_10970 [Phycisphaerales bacterium]|nr:MAG: hypothetical protein EA379_10970 [Phycisphaerales bacterium]
MRLHTGDPERNGLGAKRLSVVSLFAFVLMSPLPMLAPGCRVDGGGRVTDATNAPSDAIERLEARATREAARPSARSLRAPPPPGVDPSLLARVAPDDTRARATLDEAVAEITHGAPTRDPAVAERVVPDEALRRYIVGRTLRLSGDLAAAERELDVARRLDEQAPEPWRELAESQSRRGARAAAMASYREVLERDPEDIRALEQLGRHALATRDMTGGATLLARAWALGPASYDPALPYIVAWELGGALRDLGYVSAGAEALALAANLPEPFPSATRYARELGALYRSRSDILRDVGDALLRLGDDSGASLAYDLASGLPSIDGATALLPRRVYAAMRRGAPARAATAIIRDIRDDGGRVEDRRLALIRHVASHSDEGPAMAGALLEIEASLGPAQRRLVTGSLARARAAALDGDRAIDALRRYIAEAPDDAGAVEDLLTRLAAQDATGAVRETIALVSASPARERALTDALLRALPDARALLARWGRIPAAEASSPAGALVRARLLQSVDLAEATATLDALLARDPTWTPALVAQIETLSRAGDWPRAERLLARIDAAAGPEARYARARALHALQRFADALETIAPLVDGAGAAPHPDHLLLAAGLAHTLNDDRVAERWLRRLIEIDPLREDGYAGLISLYAGSGPLADDARLNDTLRALRDAVPANRTLRLLRARDSIARAQYDRAERDLLDLAEQDPADAQVAELLVSVWIATGSFDRAEAWLLDRVESRPDDGAPIAELARVMAFSDRAEEGATLLRDWLVRRPGDDGASRRLEEILRGPLDRPEDADAVALMRLERAPGVIDNALEIAAIRAARREDEAAARTIVDALRPDTSLRPDQAERAQATLRTLLVRADATRPGAAETLELAEALATRLPSLPDDLHRARVRLMARMGADVASLARACDLAAAQHPESVVELYLMALDTLREARLVAEAAALARHAGTTQRPARPSLLAAWVLIAYGLLDDVAVADALRIAVEDDVVTRTQRMMSQMLRGGIPPGDGEAAELAYIMANAFAYTENPDGAENLYLLALEFDPDHPWANNNLGYRYTERGERLDEAYRMIRRALDRMPDEGAIIDSMGWVLYRMGVLEDTKDERGRPFEGAVTHLGRAVQVGVDDASPIVLDHFGDALWGVGRREEAARSWELARREASAYLAGLAPERRQRETADPLALEFLDLLKNVEQKLQAVADGEEPPVTPILGDGDLPPADAPASRPTDGPAT